MIASIARLDAADLERGRALSLPAQGNALFYYGGRRLLGDELHPLGCLVIGEIDGRRRIISLPCGWYDAGDLRAKPLAWQGVGEHGAQMAHIAAVANDQLGRKIDRQAHQGAAQGQFGDQLSFGRFVHRYLHDVAARVKALFQGAVE
jgi:hypothetical protein